MPLSKGRKSISRNASRVRMGKHFKYHGPDHLVDIDANKEGVFQHNFYTAGEMFINAIGDVHQSFTMEEGVKLFVMWGDGNADISDDKYPRGSGFLNVQSAKAWE
eukprot:352230_1